MAVIFKHVDMKTTFYSLLIFVLFPFYAQAQWEQTNGPFGAYEILSIVEHDGVIFVNAAGSGIFRSLDFGEHWVMVRDAKLLDHRPALHITDNGILFASDSGIVRSMDYGNTWVAVNNGLEGYDFNSIDSDTSGVVYTTSIEGYNGESAVYKSDNNGETWRRVLVAGMDFSSLHVTCNGTVWYASYKEIWRSDDKGENWISVFLPLSTFLYSVNSINSDSTGSVYFSTDFYYSLWKTKDNGITWIKLLDFGDIGGIKILEVDHDNDVIASLNGSINRSIDGGYTWQEFPSKVIGYAFKSVNSDTLLSGYSNFLISMDDGNTWQIRNNGIIATSINSIAVTPQEKIFAINGRLWMSDDMGNTWNDVGSNTGSNVFYSIKNYPSGLYLVSEINHDERFLRSVDEGASWQEINFDAEVRDFSINSLGHIFVSTTQYLFRSTDDGETWDLLEHMDDEIYIEKLAINSNDAILIKTRDSDYFMVSHDNGDTWTVLDKLDNDVKFIKADTSGNFYYSAGGHLMRYSWVPSETSYILEDITLGQNNITVISLYIKPDNDLFVSTTQGLYHSSDDGLTWTDFYSETVTPNAIFYDMAFAPKSGFLYGGHITTGVWRISLGIETDVHDIALENSSTISVYPNPAINTVTISSNNNQTKEDDIIIMFDQKGSIIKQTRLVNSTATLSLQGIKPGIYMLKAGAGKGVKVIVK